MKTSFRGYYKPSDQDFDSIWKDAVFVLDANVLLNMYGYSDRTRGQLISLLKSIEQRLWIPHQFAKEYQRNRAKAISEQVLSYTTAKRELTALLDQRLRVKHRHPFVGRPSLLALERICKELDRGQKKHEQLFKVDPIFAELSRILEGRVGTPLTQEELAAQCMEGRARYATKVPPGYSDSAKPEPDMFGDFFGWKEILAHGMNQNAPTILVTDDQKVDWWHTYNKERRLGPRPELIAEYWDKCQKPFYMYTLEEFMRFAGRHLDQKVTPAALEELRERSVSQTEGSAGDKPKSDRPEFGAKSVDVSPLAPTYLSVDDTKPTALDKPIKP